MLSPSRRIALGYAAVVLGAFLVALLAGWTTPAVYIDNDAYDLMFRLQPVDPWEPEAVLLAIDEPSLVALGGVRNLRTMLASGLERLAEANPRVVVIDLILADKTTEAEDARLEEAFSATPRLILSSDLMPGGDFWEEPLPRFAQWAEGIGHVHADQDPLDGVSRTIPLEKASREPRRKWALALEAYRASRGAEYVEEAPGELTVAGLDIPAPRTPFGRRLFVRYWPVDANGASALPRIPVKDLLEKPEAAGFFRNRVVFVGVTAQSAARDRLMTPYSSARMMTGVEIHASAFETLRNGRFLTPAPELAAAGLCLLIAAAAGAPFAFRSGWQPYALAGLVLLAAHAITAAFFAFGLIVPYFSLVSAAWLSAAAAASYQHFVVRKQLQVSETDRTRYREAMHFVTHELKTPLTAIQGSSELIGRYNLEDGKRRQMAQLINTESKRLAKMIETFLNVERLSAGQMELRKEPVNAAEVVRTCVERTLPLAGRKDIRISLLAVPDAVIIGDHELLEYAVFNLLTNAVKYSPGNTEVTVWGEAAGPDVRISVRDQGIGMDAQELKNIFRKFYRTGRAQASGEKGTGIGLSIVQQIVTHHGGRVAVASEPGKGSCFSLTLPAQIGVGAGAGGDKA